MADVSAPTPLADDALETTDLNITGMSCAACARRIERQLGRTPGVVAATVNFATSRARVVTSTGGVPTDKVIGVVEQTGFGASVITSPADALRAQQQAAQRETLDAPFGQFLLGGFEQRLAQIAVVIGELRCGRRVGALPALQDRPRASR